MAVLRIITEAVGKIFFELQAYFLSPFHEIGTGVVVAVIQIVTPSGVRVRFPFYQDLITVRAFIYVIRHLVAPLCWICVQQIKSCPYHVNVRKNRFKAFHEREVG